MKTGVDVGVEAPIDVEVVTGMVSRIQAGIVVAVVEAEVRVKKAMVPKVASGTEVVFEVAAPAVRARPVHSLVSVAIVH